jgi:hypothetical protein
VKSCTFWGPVFEQGKQKIGEEEFTWTLNNVQRFESFKSLSVLVNTFSPFQFNKKSFKRYSDNTYAFLKLVSQNSGINCLADISKNPIRAYNLSKHPNIDLRIIHLVRDGKGVAYSMKKKSNHPVWRTALFWMFINILSNRVLTKYKKHARIKYEDFVQGMKSTIDIIGDLCEIDMTPVTEKLDDEFDNASHIIAGNRLRKSGKIQVKIDSEWRTKLSKFQIFQFNFMGYPLMKKYRYL